MSIDAPESPTPPEQPGVFVYPLWAIGLAMTVSDQDEPALAWRCSREGSGSAEVRYPHLAEEVRLRDSTRRVGTERTGEIGVRERRAEVRYRLPDGVVHQHTTRADSAMQLRGDVAGLPLHPVGVLLPGSHERRDIAFKYGKDVDQNDRRGRGLQLLLNGVGRIERA